MNRDEQMQAWERVRGDAAAVKQVIAEERKTMPWLGPDRLPRQLLQDMETAERRYQRWVQGLEEE